MPPLGTIGLVDDVRQFLLTRLPSFDFDQVTTTALADDQVTSPQRPMLIVRPAGGPDGDGDFGHKRLSVYAVAEDFETARMLHQQARLVLLAYTYPVIAAGEPQDVDYALPQNTSRPAVFCDYFAMIPANLPS